MKRQIILIAGIALVVGANARAELVVAGWDGAKTLTNSYTPRVADITASNVSASVAFSTVNGVNPTNDWVVSKTGSGDSTFGTFAGARTNTNTEGRGAFLSLAAGVYMDYTITNNGAIGYDLTAFHFDVWRKFAGSGTPSVSVLAGGGITAGNLTITNAMSALGATPPTYGADYSDVDISLAGLADYTLAAGESATFRILVNTNGGAFIDNIAFTGLETIPEPKTLSLVVISMVGLVILRKSRV